jgi:hypothetical protein
MKKIAYPDNPLTRKMQANGWDTVEDFFNSPGVKEIVSKTTLLSLLLHGKKIVEPIFIKVAEAMRFTPNEIRDLLVHYGYKDFVHLIGDHKGVTLSEKEEALLSIYKKIINRHPNAAMLITSYLETLCLTVEIDCFDELNILRKKD